MQYLSDPALFVGGIEKNEIELFPSARQRPHRLEDRGYPYLAAVRQSQRPQILPDGDCRFPGRIHQDRLGRAATEGLDRKIAGPGEEIEHPQSGKVMGEDIEQRLLDSAGGRAKGMALRDSQTMPLDFAGNDSHASISYLQNDLTELLSIFQSLLGGGGVFQGEEDRKS